MPFSRIEITPKGRAVHVAAFELAMTRIAATNPPAAADPKVQEELVVSIIECAAAGTSDVFALADRALASVKLREVTP